MVAEETCYLCGHSVDDADRSVDHVPPKLIFPKMLRRERNFSNFWTVPSHKTCNHGFSQDEEYFFFSLGLLCNGSTTGRYAAETVIESAGRDDNRLPLHAKIYREFTHNPVTGELRKTFDHDRLYRVAHKIVRGLWFIRGGRDDILSPECRVDFALYDRNNRPPAMIEEIMAFNKLWGEYPDVFHFKAFTFPEGPAHVFTLVFWEWLLIVVTIHEPACACPSCARV